MDYIEVLLKEFGNKKGKKNDDNEDDGDQNIRKACDFASKYKFRIDFYLFRYLENEIHKTSLKMNEADMIKKKYELILDMLKKERLNYTKQINKMEMFEADQMKEIASLEKDYEEAVEFRDEIRGEQKEWEDHFTQELKLRHTKVTETKKIVKEKKDIFNSLETIFSKTETDRKTGSDSERGSMISKPSTKKGSSLWPSTAEVTHFHNSLTRGGVQYYLSVCRSDQ